MISFDLGGNLSYEIPTGVGDDLFTVDPVRGIVTTRAQIDRETKDFYTVPIYVTESITNAYGNSQTLKPNDGTTQFDVATLVIKITDVNDHAPEFRPGTCYPLAVPENREASIIHTIVATDLDEGLNGDIIYSISGNLFFNQFMALASRNNKHFFFLFFLFYLIVYYSRWKFWK